MPPSLVKTKSQEKMWEKAKKAAASSGDAKGDSKWRLTNYIFQRIKGAKK